MQAVEGWEHGSERTSRAEQVIHWDLMWGPASISVALTTTIATIKTVVTVLKVRLVLLLLLVVVVLVAV